MDTDGLMLQHQGISSDCADSAPIRLKLLEVNTLTCEQNGHHFVDQIFECIFFN